ncbi:MAG: hypothetical protein IKC30_06185, partial [Rikenellaceae bacterium]|nr:hypothetical protein [Rikenellaceae bacterium]
MLRLLTFVLRATCRRGCNYDPTLNPSLREGLGRLRSKGANQLLYTFCIFVIFSLLRLLTFVLRAIFNRGCNYDPTLNPSLREGLGRLRSKGANQLLYTL